MSTLLVLHDVRRYQDLVAGGLTVDRATHWVFVGSDGRLKS
jgi:hypothetical protein